MKLEVRKDMVEERKKEVESLLDFLENEYRGARISENTYLELRQKNMKKLEKLKRKLKIGIHKKKEAKSKMVTEKVETQVKRDIVGEIQLDFDKKPEGAKITSLEQPKKEKSKFSLLSKISKKTLKKREKQSPTEDEIPKEEKKETPKPEEEEKSKVRIEKPKEEHKTKPEELKGEQPQLKKPKEDTGEEIPKEEPTITQKSVEEEYTQLKQEVLERGKPKSSFFKKILKKMPKPNEGKKREKTKDDEISQPTEKEQVMSSKENVDQPKDEKPKSSFFKKILKKKSKDKKQEDSKIYEEETSEGPEFVDPLKGPPEEEPETTQDTISSGIKVDSNSAAVMELEKMKVVIDVLKERDKSFDERLSTISENLGEMRSLVFQADGNLRETSMRLQTIDEELTKVNTKEIEKKFSEKDAIIEKHALSLEMLSKKMEDVVEKSNKTYFMLKSIGSLENIGSINKNIAKKLEEIKGLVKYMERISAKTEKFFIGMNKSMEDFSYYRAKIISLDELTKDLIKGVDSLNIKFEDYITKRDINEFKEELIMIHGQLEHLNSITPIAEFKIPEKIKNLKREKGDIKTLLESLKENYEDGGMSEKEYGIAKKRNEMKITKIDDKLDDEWAKLKRFIAESKVQMEENSGSESSASETSVEEEQEKTKQEEISEKQSEEEKEHSGLENSEKEEERIKEMSKEDEESQEIPNDGESEKVEQSQESSEERIEENKSHSSEASSEGEVNQEKTEILQEPDSNKVPEKKNVKEKIMEDEDKSSKTKKKSAPKTKKKLQEGNKEDQN